MGDASQVVYAIGRTTPSGLHLLGTAFSVGGGYFATPFHVATANDQGLHLLLPRIGSLNEYQDASSSQYRAVPVAMAAADPIKDICLLHQAAVDAGGLSLGSTDEVPVGGNVEIFGFPHAGHGRWILTQQHASVGARVLIASSGQKSKHIVLNVQARDGQSGSPVLNSSVPNRVVAMVLGSYAPGGGGGISLGGVDPQTLHQTTHAVSAEYIAAMIP